MKMVSMEMPRQQAPGNTQVIPNQYNFAPGQSTQGSNQAHTSSIPLMSQQQAWQSNTSTSVQASSLTNKLSVVNKTSTVQNMSAMPHNTTEYDCSQYIYAAQRQLVGSQQSEQSIYHQHEQPSLQSHQPNIHLQQQQQQLVGHQQNLQENQPIGQQNCVVEMEQQQRLPVQSNIPLNVQQTQQMLNQQYMPLHYSHQLGSQANMLSRQQQQQNQHLQLLLGTVPNVSSMQPMHLLHIEAQQPQQQQHALQPPMGLMQPQIQHNQLRQSQQHLMSQFQSQPNELKHQFGMQPQSSMQQRLQTSGGMLLQQNNMDQIQAQGDLKEISSSASLDSTAQADHGGAGDYWQEEIYQTIKILKDQYFAELSELYNKISVKLQHVESNMPPPGYDTMKSFIIVLDRILQMLQISKCRIQPAMRDRVPQYEKQIISILNLQRNTVQPQIQQ